MGKAVAEFTVTAFFCTLAEHRKSNAEYCYEEFEDNPYEKYVVCDESSIKSNFELTLLLVKHMIIVCCPWKDQFGCV